MEGCAPPDPVEDYLDLENYLIAAEKGRIKSALMVDWIHEHCDGDIRGRVGEIWVERITGKIGEDEAVERLYELVKECIRRAEEGRVEGR